MDDLAVVIVVSRGEAKWIRPCLSTLYDHLGDIRADVVIADNGDEDTRAIVEEFPAARAVATENRGFSHANNRAVLTCDARYVLFLNPDTEVVEGTFETLLERLDRSPEVGAVGVRQLSPDGTLHPTIRLFPTPLRVLGEAFAGERLPVGRLRQRVLEPAAYERETPCDWTSGSFVLCRREALESAGIWDERFFIYSEEVDLCKRIRDAGWQILHLPSLTIVHHVGKGVRARTAHVRTAQQNAFGLLQYAEKHFTPGRRAAFLGALGAYYGLRALPRPGGDADARAAARRALAVLAGRAGSPYLEPPATALEAGAASAVRIGIRPRA